MPYLLFLLCSFFPVWIFIRMRKNTKAAIAHIRAQKKDQGEKITMLKVLESLIGKRCSVHTVDNDYDGIIEKLEDNCIVLKELYYDTHVFVNPEYVVGIVERKEKKKKTKKAE